MYFDQSGLALTTGQPQQHNADLLPPELQSEYVQIQCVLADGGDRYGVSAVAFDRYEELVWMGNQGGHVTSYYTGAMQKYTSFQVTSPTDEIRQILTVDEGILALSANQLRLQIRRGLPAFTHSSPNMSEMQCMMQMGSSSRLLIGGHHGKLVDFNLELGKEARIVEVGEAGCVMLRPHSRYVCAGDPLGRIDLRDPNSLNVEHSLETHSGSLSDFDVQGNLLVTCGFSNRHGTMTVDRFLMVYDLRMMRAISPIQTVLDPLYLRFVPSISSRLAVVSAMGHAQLVDTIAFAEPRMCLMQMDTPAMCLCFDISTTSQSIIFGDNAGSMHLFASVDQPLFNNYSRMTEHADTVISYPSFAIDDETTPLSVIPMPFVSPDVPLLSDWPEHLMRKVYRPTPPIDGEILRTMKMKGSIGYAPNPNTNRRNQVMYNLTGDSSSSSTDRRHQIKSKYSEKSTMKKSQQQEQSIIHQMATGSVIPKRYRKLDMKYTKLGGTDELQFGTFNRTTFTGLEATLPNAYCNSMIQVLYFIEPLRAALLSHLCQKEFCLSCELGFLFYMMMTNSTNQPCQPANFLRAFRTIPEAAALSLVYTDATTIEQKLKMDLSTLIQSWNRFIIHQLHVELGGARDNDTSSDIMQLFGIRQIQLNTCLKCKHEVNKPTDLLVCNLVYPTCSAHEPTFCQILTTSLGREQVTPAWCDVCKRFSPTSQKKHVQHLPHLLAINTGLQHGENQQFWWGRTPSSADQPIVQHHTANTKKPCRYGDHCSRPGCRFQHNFDGATVAPSSAGTVPTPPPNDTVTSSNWLPHTIYMHLDGTNLQITTDSAAPPSDCYVYDLTAVVCHVNDANAPEKRNLVGLVKVAPSTNDRWYLFNDFSIVQVAPTEATTFPMDWKVPAVLYFTRRPVDGAGIKCNVVTPITKDVFKVETCNLTRRSGATTFTELTEYEYPKAGDLVAIDAEFVTLNQEEAELRSDGKMSMVKPSQMSVARITCIRGWGSLEGVPFIDDYISTQEQVVDYLTKFSGIKPGDLDANFSSKHLTTLKSTYVKLRFLLDLGVIFVGHGLKNDFRVINLVVPPDQIRDTVLLFHLPHHRMVSLRFLAWYFLRIRIQAETHDSAEDARAALHLYRKYEQLERENGVGVALAELYERGAALNWKVPDENDG